MNDEKQKKCNACNIVKNLSEFAKSSSVKSGYGAKCKECYNEYHKNYKLRVKATNDYKLRNYLKNKLENIKRQDKRKFPEHDFNLTLEDLLEIYNKYNGICVYSGKLLKPGSRVNIYAKISFDRIDNDLPHTKDNLQLVSVHMNLIKGSKKSADFARIVNNII